jgi:uncharacterized protein Veg
MRAETSKEIENTSSQSGKSIAEGKRKGESYGEALSLQDVFSDSASATGSSQKTSRLPADEAGLSKSGQEKGAQLEKKVNRKQRGGRRKLEQNQKRLIKLQAHVTAMEYEKLNDQFRATGMRYFSDYLRLLILDRGKARSITNKQELIKQLDMIGIQINRLGNNINQIAKYANIQLKSGKIDQRTIERFNNLMEDYLKEERNLINAYRALARNKG